MNKPIKLHRNWRSAWRWFSVQAMALALAIHGSWLALPANLISHISDSTKTYIVIALLVLGIIGRLVDQSDKETSK